MSLSRFDKYLRSVGLPTPPRRKRVGAQTYRVTLMFTVRSDGSQRQVQQLIDSRFSIRHVRTAVEALLIDGTGAQLVALKTRRVVRGR